MQETAQFTRLPAAVRDGDHDASVRLYEMVYDDLCGTALDIGGSANDAPFGP